MLFSSTIYCHGTFASLLSINISLHPWLDFYDLSLVKIWKCIFKSLLRAAWVAYRMQLFFVNVCKVCSSVEWLLYHSYGTGPNIYGASVLNARGFVVVMKLCKIDVMICVVHYSVTVPDILKKSSFWSTVRFLWMDSLHTFVHSCMSRIALYC